MFMTECHEVPSARKDRGGEEIQASILFSKDGDVSAK